MDNTPDIQAALTPIVEALEQLGVPYHIGGSVASSLYGLPRLTIDVDLVADLRLRHVRPLVKRLQETYYIDEDMVRDAISRHSSFNIIHQDTILKVDILASKVVTVCESGLFCFHLPNAYAILLLNSYLHISSPLNYFI